MAKIKTTSTKIFEDIKRINNTKIRLILKGMIRLEEEEKNQNTEELFRHSQQELVEIVNKKYNNLYGEHFSSCPICGCIAHIDEVNNKIICYGNSDCACANTDETTGERKGLTPYKLLQKYYNVEDIGKTFNLYNKTTGSDLYVIASKKKVSFEECLPSPIIYDDTLMVEKYASEQEEKLIQLIQEHKKVMINANTGCGKTFAMVNVAKELDTDYIFFFVPVRSIAEDFANDKKYAPYVTLFYGNMSKPQDLNKKIIICTYDKIYAVKNFLQCRQIEIYANALKGITPKILTYSVIVDECHELTMRRSMHNKVARTLETFANGSVYRIFMSANTDFLANGYKDKTKHDMEEDIKQRVLREYKDFYLIQIKQNTSQYNSNNLYIKRLSKNKQLAKTISIVKEALNNHKHVLFMENDIDNLCLYARTLEKENIECIVINSENKTEEEVANEYYSIVKNGKITKKVVFCTSTINAGVNIDNTKNVATMIKQSHLTFDPQMIEQFLGRIRTDKGNDCYVILNNGNDTSVKHTYKEQLDFNLNKVRNKCEELNSIYLNQYEFDFTDEDLQQVREFWSIQKNTDAIKDIKDCMYVDTENHFMTYDYMAITEKTRRDILKEHYYNDKFILYILRNIKARTIHDIEIVEGEFEDLNLEEPKKNSFDDFLLSIFDDIEAKEEIVRYFKGEIDYKELEQDKNKAFYEVYKKDKKMGDLRRTIRAYSNKEIIRILGEVDLCELFDKLVLARTKQETEKQKRRELDYILFKTYNDVYPLGTSQQKLLITQQMKYVATRTVLDSICIQRNFYTQKHIDKIITEYSNLMHYEIKETSNKKGEIFRAFYENDVKKDTVQEVVNEIGDMIPHIYNVGTTGKMNSLKSYREE